MKNRKRFRSPHMKMLCVSICCALVMSLSGVIVSGQTCASPQHVCEANTLISNLQATGLRNEYDNTSEPSYVVWDTATAEAYTNCSTFATELLKHTYGWSSTYIRNWMGTSVPNAALYHDTIWAQDRFTLIQNASQIQAGDFIAIKYPTGSSTSGHLLIAAGAAQLRTSTEPLVDNFTQYEVSVIDSSKSYHGSSDTRYPNGEGVGRGVFRIYADSNNNIVGYTWSTFSNSEYHSQSENHLVVGRLN